MEIANPEGKVIARKIPLENAFHIKYYLCLMNSFSFYFSVIFVQDEEQQQIHNATIGKKMAKKKPSTKLRRPSEHRIQDSLTYQKPVLDPSNSMTPTDIAEAIIALEGSRYAFFPFLFVMIE